MYSSPLHHQADHPALVVQCVVPLFLLTAPRGLGMVGAQQLKIKQMKAEHRNEVFVIIFQVSLTGM